jgi:glucose/arabinose dehydrogenase
VLWRPFRTNAKTSHFSRSTSLLPLLDDSDAGLAASGHELNGAKDVPEAAAAAAAAIGGKDDVAVVGAIMPRIWNVGVLLAAVIAVWTIAKVYNDDNADRTVSARLGNHTDHVDISHQSQEYDLHWNSDSDSSWSPQSASRQTQSDGEGSESAFSTIRINCGGGAVRDAQGNVWLKDQYFNKGFRSPNVIGRLKRGNGGSSLWRKSIYTSYRYDYALLGKRPLQYTIPVPNGEYEVTLYFPDRLVKGVAPKLRRFTVQLEDLVSLHSDEMALPRADDNNAAAPAASLSSLILVSDQTLEIALSAPWGRRVYVAAIVVESLDASSTDLPTPSPFALGNSNPTLPPARLRAPTTRAPILQSAPSAPFDTIRINAGGDAYIDALGQTWQADVNYTGGQTYAVADIEIADTTDDVLYQAERNGNSFEYQLPVPVGNYEVSLHCAELVYTAEAERVFSVEMEDTLVFTDVDLIQRGAGTAHTALVLETVQLVSDGILSIVFTAKVGVAQLSAIQVKLSAPHYAHAVTNGPYMTVDSLGVGLATMEVDGSNSHTHGPGLRLESWVWKSAVDGAVLGRGEWANLTLPVGDHIVTLTVTDDGGNESTDTTNVTIRSGAFPSVTSVLPNSGPNVGGNDVTIVGSGFTVPAEMITVKFGLVSLTGSAALTILDARTIKVKAPAVSVGVPVSVSVVTPLGESAAKKYTYVAASEIKFLESRLTTLPFPTRAIFGPDKNLYVSTVDGKIAKYTLDKNYRVVSTMVSTVALGRAILGLAFDPMDTSTNNPRIYFAHWRLYHGESKSTSGQAINGKISIASGANLDTIVDVIMGLPVSDADHGINGLEFGDEGELYIQVGSNTNGGVPGRLTTTQKQKDQVFSAATLVAYLSKPNFRGVLTYTADDDGDANPSDVEVFAFGNRNPLGIVLHSNGNLYGTDNGPDIKYGDMLTSCTGSSIEGVDEKDKVNLLVKGGYYGHPNLKRGRSDPRQCTWRSPRSSGNGYTPPIVIVPSSTNGIVEFSSNHFDGQMRGNLITAQYKSGLYRIILTADGQGVVPESVEPSKFAGDGVLDITQHPDGTLIDTRYEDGDIFYYKPIIRSTRAVLVLSVFPKRGGRAGGSRLSIYGRNLNKNSATPTVKVGSGACKVTFVSATMIECTLPGGSGTVDVSVTVLSETSTFQRGYRYISGA